MKRYPRESRIKAAKQAAVGGRRKRCVKGKNCSAACIAAHMTCLVELPWVGDALGQARRFILNREQGSQPGKTKRNFQWQPLTQKAPAAGPAPSAAPAPKPKGATQPKKPAAKQPVKAPTEKPKIDIKQFKAELKKQPTEVVQGLLKHRSKLAPERIKAIEAELKKREKPAAPKVAKATSPAKEPEKKPTAPAATPTPTPKEPTAKPLRPSEMARQAGVSGEREAPRIRELKEVDELAKLGAQALNFGLGKLPARGEPGGDNPDVVIARLRIRAARNQVRNALKDLGPVGNKDFFNDKDDYEIENMLAVGKWTPRQRQRIEKELRKRLAGTPAPPGLDVNKPVRVDKKLLAQNNSVLEEVLAQRQNSLNPGQRKKIEAELQKRGVQARPKNKENSFFEDDNNYDFASAMRAPGTTIGQGAFGKARMLDRGEVVKEGKIGQYEAAVLNKLAGLGIAPELRGVEYRRGALGKTVAPGYGGHVQEKQGKLALEKAPGLPWGKQLYNADMPERKKMIDAYLRVRADLHRQGVAHNDMHGGNVFYDPKTGKAMLIDMGLAQISPKAALIEGLGVFNGRDWQADKYDLRAAKTPTVLKLQENIRKVEAELKKYGIDAGAARGLPQIRASKSKIEAALGKISDSRAQQLVNQLYEGIGASPSAPKAAPKTANKAAPKPASAKPSAKPAPKAKAATPAWERERKVIDNPLPAEKEKQLKFNLKVARNKGTPSEVARAEKALKDFKAEQKAKAAKPVAKAPAAKPAVKAQPAKAAKPPTGKPPESVISSFDSRVKVANDSTLRSMNENRNQLHPELRKVLDLELRDRGIPAKPTAAKPAPRAEGVRTKREKMGLDEFKKDIKNEKTDELKDILWAIGRGKGAALQAKVNKKHRDALGKDKVDAIEREIRRREGLPSQKSSTKITAGQSGGPKAPSGNKDSLPQSMNIEDFKKQLKSLPDDLLKEQLRVATILGPERIKAVRQERRRRNEAAKAAAKPAEKPKKAVAAVGDLGSYRKNLEKQPVELLKDIAQMKTALGPERKKVIDEVIAAKEKAAKPLTSKAAPKATVNRSASQTAKPQEANRKIEVSDSDDAKKFLAKAKAAGFDRKEIGRALVAVGDQVNKRPQDFGNSEIKKVGDYLNQRGVKAEENSFLPGRKQYDFSAADRKPGWVDVGGGAQGEVRLNRNMSQPAAMKNGKVGQYEAAALEKLQNVSNVPNLYGVRYNSKQGPQSIDPGLGGSLGPHIRERPGKLAMELKDGEPLYKVMGRNNKDQLTDDLLKARKAIHMRGVAHNDMHGGNVLYDDANKKLNVIDFGLAQISPKAALIEALGGWNARDYQAASMMYRGNGPAVKRYMQNVNNVEEKLKARGLNPEKIPGIRTPLKDIDEYFGSMTDSEAQRLIAEVYDGI